MIQVPMDKFTINFKDSVDPYGVTNYEPSYLDLRDTAYACSSQIINEMLSEIHTMKKCYFLKRMIHSKII